MNSAEFHVRFDEKYLLDATAHHRRQLWWHGQYDLLRWTLAAHMALLTVIAFLSKASILTTILSGVTGALLGAMLLGPSIDNWLAKRRLRKSPFCDNDMIFKISEDELLVTGTNGDSRLKWTAYSKARRFSDGLLLYQGPQFFNWLPDSAATDPSSVETTKDLARSQVKDYRDV